MPLLCLPSLPILTMPCLDLTMHSNPRLAITASPRLNGPLHVTSRLACPDPSCRATPSQSGTRLVKPAESRLFVPLRSMPRLPCLASPKHANTDQAYSRPVGHAATLRVQMPRPLLASSCLACHAASYLARGGPNTPRLYCPATPCRVINSSMEANTSCSSTRDA